MDEKYERERREERERQERQERQDRLDRQERLDRQDRLDRQERMQANHQLAMGQQTGMTAIGVVGAVAAGGGGQTTTTVVVQQQQQMAMGTWKSGLLDCCSNCCPSCGMAFSFFLAGLGCIASIIVTTAVAVARMAQFTQDAIDHENDPEYIEQSGFSLLLESLEVSGGLGLATAILPIAIGMLFYPMLLGHIAGRSGYGPDCCGMHVGKPPCCEGCCFTWSMNFSLLTFTFFFWFLSIFLGGIPSIGLLVSGIWLLKFQCNMRAYIRQRENIMGNDCCVITCCNPCAVAQMARQVMSYESQGNQCFWCSDPGPISASLLPGSQ